MSKLIDADVFERVLMGMSDEELCEDCCYNVVNKLQEQRAVELVYCSECKHCTKSDLPGFWHCEAWGQDVSMEYQDPEKYYCAEGEKK